MATDLIKTYCQHTPGAAGNACGFLMFPEICRLLRDHQIEQIFQHGPCDPPQFLRKKVRAVLRKYRDLIEPADYLESLVFELTQDLAPRTLAQTPTLIGLVKYFGATAAHAVIDLLETEGVLLSRTCGDCRYLSQSEPFRCLRQVIIIFHAQGEMKTVHSRYNQERRPSAKACAEGFERYGVLPIDGGDPVNIPVSASAAVNFTLSEYALQNLAREGLPAAIIEALRPLAGREFADEAAFWQAIAAQLGPVDSDTTPPAPSPYQGEGGKFNPPSPKLGEGPGVGCITSRHHYSECIRKYALAVPLNIANALDALAERAEQAQTTHQRRIAERRLLLFSYLAHLFDFGYSKKEAVREIRRILNIGKRMFYADLQAIEEFLALP